MLQEPRDIEEVLNKQPLFANAKVTTITKIQGDASARSFYRIFLDAAPYPSVVLMRLVGSRGPAVAGDATLDQDESFVEMQRYYTKHGVRVPKLFVENLAEHFLIVEDVGRDWLARFCVELNDEIRAAFPQFPDPRKEFFRQALSILKTIQSAPRDESCIAFRRWLSFDQYRSDASSIINNYLVPLGASNAECQKTQEIIDRLCERIVLHPTSLSHRDFMAWNLEVSQKGEVVLLDFQDGMIASQEFDIVCLLHDRDVDFQLGPEFLTEVLVDYRKIFGRGDDFAKRYQEILLYRYIRLTGHFNMLTKKLGNPIYAGWVPGCLRRVGQALSKYGEFTELVDLLGRYSKEIKSGSEEGLRIF